jgi:hypothetical protein
VYASKSALSLKHPLVRALRPLGTRGQYAGLQSGLSILTSGGALPSLRYTPHWRYRVHQQVATVTQASSSAGSATSRD